MPIISVVIAPQPSAVAYTVWVCSVCGRDARLLQDAHEPLSGLEFFTDVLGWAVTTSVDDVLCNLCIPVIAARLEVPHVLA